MPGQGHVLDLELIFLTARSYQSLSMSMGRSLSPDSPFLSIKSPVWANSVKY
ncbi:MAG: hypothetical protein ACMUIA_10340 [bacterium]